MHEWVMIALAGATGGASITVFADQPTSFSWKDGRALIVNALGGCMAGLILWATYTSNDTFDSTKFTPAEVLETFVIGLGGVGAGTALHASDGRCAHGRPQHPRQPGACKGFGQAGYTGY